MAKQSISITLAEYIQLRKVAEDYDAIVEAISETDDSTTALQIKDALGAIMEKSCVEEQRILRLLD